MGGAYPCASASRTRTPRAGSFVSTASAPSAAEIAERFVSYESDEQWPDPALRQDYDAAYAAYRGHYAALYER